MSSGNQRAAELTELLRASDDPLWARLRQLLAEKGLDPKAVIVADLFPDDTSLEFGLVVTPDHRVFQFDFDYLRKTIATGVFSSWRDMTDTWRDSPYDEQIHAAFQLAT